MNRKIKFLTLLILIVLSSNSVIGQTTTENITTDFFKLYEKSPQKAVEYIFATNKWMMDRNKDGIEKVKIQLLFYTKARIIKFSMRETNF